VLCVVVRCRVFVCFCVLQSATECTGRDSDVCVTVCCSVLQCVAVCCSVLQCVVVCFSLFQCVAVGSNLLQCVAVYSGRMHE